MIKLETLSAKDGSGWICNFRISNPSIKNCGIYDVKILFSLFGFILVKKEKK